LIIKKTKEKKKRKEIVNKPKKNEEKQHTWGWEEKRMLDLDGKEEKRREEKEIEITLWEKKREIDEAPSVLILVF
jgi:hypothetical protein